MVSVPVRSVEEKYRPYALMLIAAGMLAVILQFLSAVFFAVMTRHAPPVENTIVDGALHDQWGTVPYIVIDGRGHEVNEDHFHLFDAYYTEYGDTFHKLHASSPDFSITQYGTSLVLNLSAYVPDFDRQVGSHHNFFPSTMQPQFEFCWASDSGYFDIFTVPANAPVEAFDATSPSASQYFVHQAAVPHSYYQTAELEKKFVPARAVYWGFPGELPPVEEEVKVTSGSAINRWANSGGCLHLSVKSSMVSRTTPISVRSQIIAAASNAGGSITLVSTLFIAVFVKKYPATTAETKSQELTLRGCEVVSAVPDGSAEDKFMLLAA